MENPLCRFHSCLCRLPMHYCGTIHYYALLAAYEGAVIDCAMPYNKRQKDTHRCVICDTHGPLRLTVPVSLPSQSHSRHLSWEDIDVSPHGQWWKIHLTALESAYGRTPYFQFYIDRFLPAFTDRYETETVKLWELDRFINDRICEILSIANYSYNTTSSAASIPENTYIKDYRNHDRWPRMIPVEYYQIRKDSLGFCPDMSILDLIFNMGPEAVFILRDCIKSLKEL